jgi:glucose uptake protein GlcU
MSGPLSLATLGSSPEKVHLFGDVEMDRETAGLLAVFASVLAFGTFVIPMKHRPVVEAKVDPAVFQLYYSFSVFCTSFLVLIYVPFEFNFWGVLGAALWVPASLLSIAVVRFVGMAVGMGIWAGTSIVVSFLWGALVFHNHIKDVGLSVLALGLLCVGIGLLSFSASETVARWSKPGWRDPAAQALINPGEGPTSQASSDQQRRPLLGIALAVLLGLLNGSMMAPLSGLPEKDKGIGYIVPFSIGVVIVTPVFVAIYFLILSIANRSFVRPVFHFRVAFVPALLTGLMWQIGNYFSIYATLLLGMTVGFPLTQLALVVSGFWGIVLYKEVAGKGIFIWLGGTLVLGAGAALLVFFG